MMDLHKIFEKAQQRASKLEDTYKMAFEKTGYSLVSEPHGENFEIKTSQQGVEVSHEWNSSEHRYMPNKIKYNINTNLSELTPQQILKHFSHASGMTLEADYDELKIPLPDLKKYPALDEAIEFRRQKEGKKLEELIESVRPVTDMRRHFNFEELKQLKEKVVHNLPCIEIWSDFEDGKNPQIVAEDLIDSRMLIEKLKREKERAKASIKALSDPRYVTQRMIVSERLNSIENDLGRNTPLDVGRLRAYKDILFGEKGREVEIELERLYGHMKFELNISPPEPFVRVYRQELRANPHFNIPETRENAILASPSGLRIYASYKEEAKTGSVSLSWPVWANKGEGKFKLKHSTTSVKADLSRTNSEAIENILTDMEHLTNNISKE